MKVDKVYGDHYAINTIANDGEEMLVILASPGQSGRWSLVVVAMQCDMGKTTLYDDEPVPGLDLDDLLRRIIAGWDKPNVGGIDSVGNVDRIMNVFNAHWERPDDEEAGRLTNRRTTKLL